MAPPLYPLIVGSSLVSPVSSSSSWLSLMCCSRRQRRSFVSRLFVSPEKKNFLHPLADDPTSHGDPTFRPNPTTLSNENHIKPRDSVGWVTVIPSSFSSITWTFL